MIVLLEERPIDRQNAIHHLAQTIIVPIALRLEEGAHHLHMETHTLPQQFGDAREVRPLGQGMEAATEQDQGLQ